MQCATPNSGALCLAQYRLSRRRRGELRSRKRVRDRVGSTGFKSFCIEIVLPRVQTTILISRVRKLVRLLSTSNFPFSYRASFLTTWVSKNSLRLHLVSSKRKPAIVRQRIQRPHPRIHHFVQRSQARKLAVQIRWSHEAVFGQDQGCDSGDVRGRHGGAGDGVGGAVDALPEGGDVGSGGE